MKHSSGYVLRQKMTDNRVENSSGRAARAPRLALMGPASAAAIGYIDPGNFATNTPGRRQLLATSHSGWWPNPDGDADSNPLGKTWNRHGQEPRREQIRATIIRARW